MSQQWTRQLPLEAEGWLERTFQVQSGRLLPERPNDQGNRRAALTRASKKACAGASG